MSKRRQSNLDSWFTGSSSKRSAIEAENEPVSSSQFDDTGDIENYEMQSPSAVPESPLATSSSCSLTDGLDFDVDRSQVSDGAVELPGQTSDCEIPDGSPTMDRPLEESQSNSTDGEFVCTAACCSNEYNPYQPSDKAILSTLSKGKRNFLSSWYKQHPWLTVCVAKKKAFCLYCRYAVKHDLLTFSKMGENAFVCTGFDNWKKALEKFKAHSNSSTHKEAKMKWASLGKPTVQQQLDSHAKKLQASRREGLLTQLSAVRFLLRQGIAIRGHSDTEGNLRQLLSAWANRCDCTHLKSWLSAGKYMSHDVVNEQITIMGHTVLRSLLHRITSNSPAWYSIIGDEATDVASREQLNISIRWVNNEYVVSEDPIGLVNLPNTTANMLTQVIKDLLIRCGLPVSSCRGQAFDGAANMQGRKTGVATQIRSECPAAIAVHCFAHSLNLCLQDSVKRIPLLRDTLETVREIVKLIKFSPKRLTLFTTKLLQSEDTGVTIKPLCPTRWTARTGAIEAVLKDYVILMETMEEVNQTTHDEYGLKAKGVLSALEQFDTLFGLELGYLIFSASEQVSKVLQGKNISLQDALSAVNVAKEYYKRQRKEETFNFFYERVVKKAEELKVDSPRLPRYRRRPARFEDGSHPHQFTTAKDYHRHLYYQACDLLVRELEDRFQQKDLLQNALPLESVLIRAANKEEFQNELDKIEQSCYESDFDFSQLKVQLSLLPGVIKEACPSVRKVTSIRSICDAMNAQNSFKSILSEVHKLLRLYYTIPITSATSERTFSVLRRLLTYIRSTMTEKRLNNCLILHVHKDLTDNVNLTDIAKEFVFSNDDRKRYFGNF